MFLKILYLDSISKSNDSESDRGQKILIGTAPPFLFPISAPAKHTLSYIYQTLHFFLKHLIFLFIFFILWLVHWVNIIDKYGDEMKLHSFWLVGNCFTPWNKDKCHQVCGFCNTFTKLAWLLISFYDVLVIIFSKNCGFKKGSQTKIISWPLKKMSLGIIT